jgi:hypothetical protein
MMYMKVKQRIFSMQRPIEDIRYNEKKVQMTHKKWQKEKMTEGKTSKPLCNPLPRHGLTYPKRT